MSNPNQSIKEMLGKKRRSYDALVSTNKELIEAALPVLRKIYESEDYGRIDEYIDEFLNYLDSVVK